MQTLAHGIATIRVILTGVDDRGMAVQVVTTTDAAGAYLFEGLRPGSYSVRDGSKRRPTSTLAVRRALSATYWEAQER